MATKKNDSKKVEVGIGLALAAAAAAGAYFLYGSKDAKKNRKAVKGWVIKAKGEVVEKIEQVKGELTEENYHKIVDGVVAKYSKLKTTTTEEVEGLLKDLKNHWKNIKKHAVAVKPAAKKTAKK
jgi:flagellar basal body-associated protein FliL